MADSNRKTLVPHYFVKTPEAPGSNQGAVAAMIIGLILALVGLMATFNAGCGGLILILIGGGVAFGGFSSWSAHNATMETYKKQYDLAEPKPTDQQMDAWLSQDVTKLKSEAIRKLDLNVEDIVSKENSAPTPVKAPEPLLIVGPADSTKVAVGKDGIIRFSKYDIVIIYLTNYHLAAYEATLDMASGDVLKDSTQEYHYTDVVSVATQTGSKFNIEIDDEKKQIETYQQFALAVASGDHINVVVAFPQKDQLKEYFATGELAPSGAEDAIRVIRSRLREKKGGVLV